MKKTKQIIFILLFICGIALPVPLWAVVGPYFDKEGTENRTLAGRPEFSAENYGSFAKEYEAYFNDHLPFREELIGMEAMTDFLLYKSSSDRVIAGKDGWLFYSAKNDGDPLKNYTGDDLLSKSQLKSIAEKLGKVDEYMKSRGGRFILFIAPNKERVYSEYMPEKYGAPAEQSAVTQLIAYLEKNTDVEVIYCLDELLEAKEGCTDPLYYKTDTHWNQLGGYVGSRVLLQALDVELPKLGDGAEYRVSGQSSGDLARYLHLEWMFGKADNEYEVKGYENVHDNRKICLYVDSFYALMLEQVKSCFEDMKGIHFQNFKMKDMLEYDPDIFVYECVERYLPQLVFLDTEGL
ncbi:MAG: hypothetical protein K5686_01585 [Lachnospiraceae bacterium]|nr:hypothetical protein [Lachnospiraceae bacterium]